MAKVYYKSGGSNLPTFRSLPGDYGHHNRYTVQGIGKIRRKLEETESVTGVVRPVHYRNVRTIENIDSVSESVADNPNLSIPRRSQQLDVSYGSLWRILPYKVQLKQQLKPNGHLQRRRYADWLLEQQAFNADFSNKNFFNDEAHFSFDGYVNK